MTESGKNQPENKGGADYRRTPQSHRTRTCRSVVMIKIYANPITENVDLFLFALYHDDIETDTA